MRIAQPNHKARNKTSKCNFLCVTALKVHWPHLLTGSHASSCPHSWFLVCCRVQGHIPLNWFSLSLSHAPLPYPHPFMEYTIVSQRARGIRIKPPNFNDFSGLHSVHSQCSLSLTKHLSSHLSLKKKDRLWRYNIQIPALPLTTCDLGQVVYPLCALVSLPAQQG